MKGKGKAAAARRSTFDRLDAGDVASLKSKLSQANGSLQDDVLDTLFSHALCPNVYDKACKAKKDSPNCLCGLIPAPGGYRKKGLWQKDSKALLTQGPDPAIAKREDPATPSGLNNLGNTCYVNSALQCLFNIPAFKSGLYALDAHVAEEPVVSHIRELFAALQGSVKSSADPTAFANSLSLDNSVQQDGQEFFKLLLSHLEGKLARSDSQRLRELVPSLFRGAYAYETTCQACGRKSESSHRETHFYELDIQVKGVPTLEQSMEEMVQVEWMNGDNQYFCSFCQAKVDASRQLRLQRLPPFLCLSLQRFVFNMKKLTKVKAVDKISFPLSLDLTAIVAPNAATPNGGAPTSQPGYQYELAAILVHKGQSAAHGHYVAHIKDESTGKWWRFDDETVTGMPAGPLGEHRDHGVAFEKKPPPEKKVPEKKAAEGAKGGAKNKRRKPEVVVLSDDDAVEIVRHTAGPKRAKAELADVPVAASVSTANGHAHAHAGTAGSVEDGGAAKEGRITSGNAYMLMYRRTGAFVGDRANGEQISLPDSLQAAVQQANDEFSGQCNEFQKEKEAMVQNIKSRQEFVRNVLESAPLQDASQECRFVSAEWLSGWVDADKDQPVNNAALLCEHGKLHPDRISAAKRISVGAWEMLNARSGGGPELGRADVCKDCFSRRLQEQEDAEQSSEHREAILAMLDNEDVGFDSEDGFYVSKTWLTGWKKRQGKGISSTSPTQGITCPHGGMHPEAVGAKAKHAVVPEPVWLFMRHSWERQRARDRLAAEKKQEEEVAAQAAVTASKAAKECVVVEEGWEPIPMELLRTNGDAGPLEPAMEEAVAGNIVDGDQGPRTPDEGEGLRVFPVASTSECQQCLQDLHVGAAAGKGLREQLGEQKAAFQALAAGVTPALEPGATYCLLPRAWLDLWRMYLQSAPKRSQLGSQELQPPPPLDEAIKQIFCPCHSGAERLLNYPPPTAVKRRGRWVVEEPSHEMLELVDPHDHARLMQLYSREGDAENPIALDDDASAQFSTVTATLEVVNRSRSATPAPAVPDAEARHSPPGDDAALMQASAAPSGLDLDPRLAAVADSTRDEDQGSEDGWWLAGHEKRKKGRERPGGEQGVFVCRPDWCRQAVQQRADAHMAAQLDYVGAEVAVELVSQATLHDPANQRKSKRARKGRAVLTMSSSQTLQQLKLMVAQHLGVHPHNALIHVMRDGSWCPLEGNHRTLKELAVLPNTDLRVLSSGEKDDEDIASFVDSPGEPSRQAVERGFVGTALTG